MTDAQPVTLAPAVRAADLGTLTLILDTGTGQVRTLTGTAHRVYAALAATGHPEAAARHAAIPAATVRQVADRLTRAAVLKPASHARPWPTPHRPHQPVASWGAQETPVRLTAIPAVPGRYLGAASIALTATLAAANLGHAHQRYARLLRLITHAAKPSRAADHDQATHAVHAVRLLARAVPARIACLEESAAAMLTLAITGRHATWCHGAAPDPLRLHAWIETAGRPIAEPADLHTYTTILRIPERHHD